MANTLNAFVAKKIFKNRNIKNVSIRIFFQEKKDEIYLYEALHTYRALEMSRPVSRGKKQ